MFRLLSRSLLVLMVAGLVYLSTDWRPLRWRIEAVALYLSGRLGEVDLTGLAEGIYPKSWIAPRDRLHSGFVRLKQHDEGAACPALWETPLGEVWGRLEDERGLEALMVEHWILDVYRDGAIGVQPGDTVLDIGSHLGIFVLNALDRGVAQVIALDPEPTTAHCFRKTFQEEIGQGRVVMVEAAAWKTNGTLQLHLPGDSLAASVYEGSVSEVRATTIDTLVSELDLDRVDFIKMDIEGAERHALEGAKDTLARFAPRMALCVYHTEDDPFVLPKAALALQPAYAVQANEFVAFFQKRGGG